LGREPPPSNLRTPPPGRGDGRTLLELADNAEILREGVAHGAAVGALRRPEGLESRQGKGGGAVDDLPDVGGGSGRRKFKVGIGQEKNITFSFALFFSVCLTFKISVSAKKGSTMAILLRRFEEAPNNYHNGWFATSIVCMCTIYGLPLEATRAMMPA